mmetsp:Transcript_9082/g.37463  ORF Transcript_9082/g.37463 Transcript_9082/m.37463 type:complete len:258 (-) Transcript_9082:616-1389(-)
MRSKRASSCSSYRIWRTSKSMPDGDMAPSSSRAAVKSPVRRHSSMVLKKAVLLCREPRLRILVPAPEAASFAFLAASSVSNDGWRPPRVGRRKGARSGALGGALGLLRSLMTSRFTSAFTRERGTPEKVVSPSESLSTTVFALLSSSSSESESESSLAPLSDSSSSLSDPPFARLRGGASSPGAAAALLPPLSVSPSSPASAISSSLSPPLFSPSLFSSSSSSSSSSSRSAAASVMCVGSAMSEGFAGTGPRNTEEK